MSQYDRLIRHRGNKDLFRVVKMSVAALLSDRPFHIQAEGLRGTGKTTIMRAAQVLLSPVKRIKSCRYNCDPAQPVSGWKEFWRAVQRWLAELLAKRPQASWGGTRIIDPLDTTIIAPPKPAVPITSLPDKQLVTRDTNTHG